MRICLDPRGEITFAISDQPTETNPSRACSSHTMAFQGTHGHAEKFRSCLLIEQLIHRYRHWMMSRDLCPPSHGFTMSQFDKMHENNSDMSKTLLARFSLHWRAVAGLGQPFAQMSKNSTVAPSAVVKALSIPSEDFSGNRYLKLVHRPLLVLHFLQR